MARILVVEDDWNVAEAIDRTLRVDGHETVVVHNGWDALEAARTGRPDLVVLDIIMPGMDGIEVCKRMRASPSMSRLPIIFLTARTMLDDKIEGFGAGADDYLTKPFAIQELGLRVRALLRRARPGPGRTEDLPQAKPDEDQELLVAGALRLNRRTYEAITPERRVLLTPIEFELLSHLMQHVGEVFSSDRLLQEVWDYPAGTGDPALVRMHVRNLRAKIEPEGVEEPIFIRTVSRRGYTVRPG